VQMCSLLFRAIHHRAFSDGIRLPAVGIEATRSRGQP
jgi:hypothetical protein